MSRTWIVVAALLLTVSLSAYAEEADSVIEDEILILATRLSETIEKTGASVTVIDEEDLKARQVRLSGDGLRQVPGAYLASGSPGSATSFFIRGAASNQAVVLVDGVQVNDPTLGGQFNFFDLGIDNIQRAEILRGGSSTLYGSDAAGGVVNFVTRRGRGEPRALLEVEGGAYGYYRFLGGATGRAGPVDFSATFSRLHSRNDLPNDDFLVDTWAGYVAYELAEGLSVRLSGRYIDADKQDPWDYPFGDQIEEDDNLERERNTTLGALGIEHDVSDVFRWSLIGSIFDVNSLLTNGPDQDGDPIELKSRAEAQVRNVTGTVTGRFTDVADWLDLTGMLGGEYEDESSENRVTTAWGPSPDLDQTVRNRAVFVLGEAVLFDRLTLSGGLRRDKNSYFGYETTASGSALYQLKEWGTRIRANYGEGYRAPKPVEFADPYVGNPALSPESSVSIDIGVEQELFEGAAVLGATWFKLRTSDLIAWDSSTGLLENFDRARTTGVELTARARLSETVEVYAWLTMQDPRNLDAAAGEERRLPGRPKQFGGGEIRYHEGMWFAGLEVYASNDYPGTGKITPDGDHRNHPGRKLLIALRGRAELCEHVVLTARLENLLDYDWYDNESAPNGLGRALYVGLECEF
jgi:vitamin B12 transporter